VRWTFTASGAVTNLAARLAAMAEAGQLLIGPETARRLDPRYHVERLGYERLKNLSQIIDVYRVLPPDEALQ
jgi:class 3 adenylate cyclase